MMSHNIQQVQPTKTFTGSEFKGGIALNQKELDLCEKIVDKCMEFGIKKNADLFNYDFAAKHLSNLGVVNSYVMQRAKESKTRTFDFKEKGYDFTGNMNGGILIDGFTTFISKVIQESYSVETGGATWLDNVFKDSMIPSQKVVVEVFAYPGGLLDAYNYGQPAFEKTKIGNRSYEYAGVPYRNYLQMTELDLTFLRDLGNPDVSARGVLQRLTMYSMQAKVLVNNRKAILKQSIFNNGLTVNGTTISYQIPSYNFVASVTDPVNNWGSYNTTTGAITVNANSNPIDDLYFYLQSYLPWIGRAEMLQTCTMVMNPITQTIMMTNPNVKQTVKAFLSGNRSAVDPRHQYSAEFIAQTFLPGFRGSVVVDGSNYLLNNSDVTWEPDGSGFTNTPVQQNYFMPVGAVLFAIDTERFGGPLGEFIYTSSVQNGGFTQANPGPFFIIEDCTAPGTRGGPLNPFINLDFGFAGGLAPYRPESTFIGQFVNLTS
jgi:hypothetical protein